MASWAWKRHFRAVQSARGSGTQNGNVDVEANGYLQFSSIFPGKIGDLGVFTLQSIYPPFSETPRKEANTLLRVFFRGFGGAHFEPAQLEESALMAGSPCNSALRQLDKP